MAYTLSCSHFFRSLSNTRVNPAKYNRSTRLDQKIRIQGILEVETYTWHILPAHLQAPLNQSIIRELNWVKNLK